jgi:hypothetical protein
VEQSGLLHARNVLRKFKIRLVWQHHSQSKYTYYTQFSF